MLTSQRLQNIKLNDLIVNAKTEQSPVINIQPYYSETDGLKIADISIDNNVTELYIPTDELSNKINSNTIKIDQLSNKLNILNEHLSIFNNIDLAYVTQENILDFVKQLLSAHGAFYPPAIL